MLNQIIDGNLPLNEEYIFDSVIIGNSCFIDSTDVIKLNLGCGNELLPGYINIDLIDKPPESLNMYDCIKFYWKADAIKLANFNDNSVEEIYAKQLIEHLDFWQESIAFNTWYRKLKSGGKLICETPDFEWLCKTFLEASENSFSFYTNSDNDYFGNGLNYNERWSATIANFFGNESAPGQYHKNAYTKKKLEMICKLLNFSSYEVTTFIYEKFNLPCLRLEAIK